MLKPRQNFLLGLLLVIVTLVLYWPVTTYQFIVIDDDQYIAENPWLAGRFSWAFFRWALTSTYAANWHPVTWISHALDQSLYGPFAGGHHFTNVLFHAANTLLVFVLLRRWTHSILASAVVAALFGWHPLHVESVAWVAERKDVLSTFFFLLTLIAYTRYAEDKRQQPGDSSQEMGVASQEATGNEQQILLRGQKPRAGIWGFYTLALVLFVLGLMSKPMVVTLPFVLLLLDYWPLRRFEISKTSFRFSDLKQLVVEKIPFLVLSMAGCAVTLLAQHSGGALRSVEEVPGSWRVLNALAGYGTYLAKTIWPVNLCVLYPLPSRLPIAAAFFSALTIAGVTWIALRWRARFPWIFVGWLWFLGTLVPVIGLVQVGNQAAADRYTYIPLIGLFFAIVLSADHLTREWRFGQAFAIGVTVIALVFSAALSGAQLGFWRDSICLCTHAVRVTRENSFAENLLGVALANAGRREEAIEHYKQALHIKPDSAPAHYNLGLELAAAGELDQASFHFSEALKTNPRSEKLHNNLGVVLAQEKRFEPAVEHFQSAIELNPEYPKPYLNCAMILQKLGRTGAAFTNYSKALQLDPNWSEALDKFAFFLANCPDERWRNPSAAISLAQRANQLSQGEVPRYLASLAEVYAAAGQYSNAVYTAAQARKKALGQGLGDLAENLERDLQRYEAGECPPTDWQDGAMRGTQR